MRVLTRTDQNIKGGASLAAHAETVVEAALARFADRVTRVDVHLSDENSAKGGEDKRCTMEARLEGLSPTAVTHQAATVHRALDGAAAKLAKAIDSTLARLRDL